MKKLVLAVSLVSFSLCLSAQTVNQNNASTNIDTKEVLVYDTVGKIPEVVNFTRIANENKTGAPVLSMYIYKRPDADRSYYWVRISKTENGSTQVVANFWVYLSDSTPAKVTSVLHYDESTAKASELSDWRKMMQAK